jgi:flagellar hook-associated protein 2
MDGGAALDVAFDPAVGGTGGIDLDHGTPTLLDGQNAEVWVDGLKFVRSSNTLSDVLPGTTLNLAKEAPGAPEDVVVGTDADATQKRLQTFVDAYNGVMSVIQKQLGVNKDADRTTSLVGVSSVRSLQEQLHRLLVTKVPGLVNVRTLADLGLKSSKDDGALSLDAARLQTVLSQDPAAANALFSTAGTGLAQIVTDLVDRNTLAGSGSLALSQDSLNRRVNDLDDQIANMQARVDAYRNNLIARFTAMESTISGLKTMGNALTSWANANTNSKSSS